MSELGGGVSPYCGTGGGAHHFHPGGGDGITLFKHSIIGWRAGGDTSVMNREVLPNACIVSLWSNRKGF